MEMIDSEKLDRALIYLDRIANGNNPVSNLPVEEDTVLNNPNVIRCMYFVKEVLQEVKRNGYAVGAKGKKQAKKDFPYEVLNQYRYYEDTTITKVLGQINQMIDTEVYKKIKVNSVMNWFVDNNYLYEELDEKTRKKKRKATEKGYQIGIRNENREFNGREYLAVVFSKQAQEFIVNNLQQMIDRENEEDRV